MQMHMGRSEYVIESMSISNMHLHMGRREYFFYYTKSISYMQTHMGRIECVIESTSTFYMQMHIGRREYEQKKPSLSRSLSHTYTHTQIWNAARALNYNIRALARRTGMYPVLCEKSTVLYQKSPKPYQNIPVRYH